MSSLSVTAAAHVSVERYVQFEKCHSIISEDSYLRFQWLKGRAAQSDIDEAFAHEPPDMV